MANNDLLKGFMLGAVVVGLAPLVAIALGGRSQAVGRGLARAGGVLAEKAREAAAELAEVAEDAAAELRSAAAAEPPPTPEAPGSDPAATADRPA